MDQRMHFLSLLDGPAGKAPPNATHNVPIQPSEARFIITLIPREVGGGGWQGKKKGKPGSGDLKEQHPASSVAKSQKWPCASLAVSSLPGFGKHLGAGIHGLIHNDFRITSFEGMDVRATIKSQ